MKKLMFAATWLVTVGTILCSSVAYAQQPPFAGGGGKEDKDPAVEKLEQAAAEAEKKSIAKPKDAKLKTEAAEAFYVAGHAKMMSSSLSARTKYRGALVHFRKALALNPKHAKAKEEKDTIEAIYKQMGRPVPQ